jgi:hypothetical protein
MIKPLVKYSRFDGKNIVLIPTKEGVEYFNQNKVFLRSDKSPEPVKLEQGQDTIGKDTVIIALVGNLPTEVIYCSNEQSVALNKNTYRFFTAGQVNYFLHIPYGIDPEKLVA